MQTIVSVPVSDVDIDAVVDEAGTVWVAVRRVCEVLGLDADSQRKKLLEKPWAIHSLKHVRDPAGRTQQTFMVALSSLPAWLCSIDHNRVDDRFVARLVTFQREAHDVLARFFLGEESRTVKNTVRPSGAASGSGGAPCTEMNSVHGSGGVLDLLAITDNLSGAIRATYMEAQAARAVADAATARAEAAEVRADDARHVAGNASALADDAQTVARLAFEEARRAGSKGIPVARRRAAVGHITRAVKAFCAKNSIGYTVVYAELRRDLGLPRKQDGGPALGTADLRADQIIRLARCANNMGIPDCGAHVIESILSGGAPVPPTIDMAPSSPARAVDSMQDFVTSKPNGPVQ